MAERLSHATEEGLLPRVQFIAKAVGLFVNCDKMIGGQFEQGLAQMKALVETADRKQALP